MVIINLQSTYKTSLHIKMWQRWQEQPGRERNNRRHNNAL